jgi:hypothetical protein
LSLSPGIETSSSEGPAPGVIGRRTLLGGKRISDSPGKAERHCMSSIRYATISARTS